MSTPRRPPEPNQPHASRDTKLRNAKGSFAGGGSGHGIGETPQSRRTRITVAILLFLAVAMIVTTFTDRCDTESKASRPLPTIAVRE